MKDIKQTITESIQDGGRNFVQVAASRILSEDISTGQTVAVIDDPITGYSGAKAKVRKISDANPGFAECEMENGVTLQLQTSLLVPV